MVNKFLVIDDEVSIGKILKKFLEKLGYSSDVATNAESGLDILRKDPTEYSCVIVDYTLPDLTFAETVGKINQINQALKIVLATGYPVEQIKSEFTNVKIDGSLQKPFSFSDFQKTLKNLLSL